jgi:hypothetical protein
MPEGLLSLGLAVVEGAGATAAVAGATAGGASGVSKEKLGSSRHLMPGPAESQTPTKLLCAPLFLLQYN